MFTLNLYTQALELHRELHNSDGMAASLNNLAALYDEQGDKRRALGYYMAAMPLVRGRKQRRGVTSGTERGAR
jgi:tetratricopeptide (TPR) repeat protein